MRLRTLLLASGALLLAFACDKKKEEPTPPAPVTPKIEIPSESQAVFSQGISIQAGTSAQSQTVKFSTTATWSADVADTKASTWLSVQPTSGSAGTVNMTVTAQPNTGTEGREASVTIKCGTVTQKFSVKQAGVSKVDVTEVTLDKAELGLVEGQEAELKATVKPDNATDKTVTWTSSDAAVATVADGKVKAVKAGTATITAKAGTKEATCKVSVTAAVVPVESIKLDKESLEMVEGDKATLTATVTPNNATDKTVTWTSSDEAIATVANGEVTAVKEGTVTITAKAGDKTATCAVKVAKNIIAVTSVTLNKNELSLSKGASEVLIATVTPEDATDKTVVWSSSDATIASVDQTGKVIAVNTGEATITAKAGDKSATCSVLVIIPVESVSLDVTSMTLKVGQKSSVLVKKQPENATVVEKTWSNTHPEVATVDMVDNIEALSVGQTVITVTIDGKSASCTITVEEEMVPEEPVLVESVTLNRNELTLSKGVSETLVATVTPENATDNVTWSSSDDTIASVDWKGKVSAVNTGVATITARAGEKEATCKITVVSSRQRFVHRSLMMFFTSIHCGYSRSMINNIHKIDAPVRDKYIRVDIHGRGMGDVMDDSPINYHEATLLESLYWFATPSAVIDSRRRLYNWADENEYLLKETLLSAIKEQEQFYPAVTGTTFTSSISGNTLYVEGAIHSGERETFKFMVYLLEDAIPDSSFGYDSYYGLLFDNVLRMSLTSTMGEEFVLSGSNTVKNFRYKVTIPDNYNKDNLSILVIVQRKYDNQMIIRDSYYGDYYVDNCRRAKVGEEAVLERFEEIPGGGNEGVDLGDEITF